MSVAVGIIVARLLVLARQCTTTIRWPITWQRVRDLLVIAAVAWPAAPTSAATNVDCGTRGAIGLALSQLRPGDVLLVRGTCRENVLIPSESNGITIDGQGKATISAPDARQPAIQILGREVIIKGFTVIGGFFGIAVNRGATAVIENNIIESAAHSGVEVSQNSFGRVVNNTIRRNRQNGILVLGSASVHIGVLRSDDQLPKPNIIQENDGDGIHVIRASTARIIGNTVSGNRGSGLAVRQTSHADVAGNVFNENGRYGIHVIGNSGVNLADSDMRLFERPNTTTTPNGLVGIRCELGAYLDGAIGSLMGKSGIKDISDSSCIDRSIP
jgi:parallel beta-helix repeat protein